MPSLDIAVAQSSFQNCLGHSRVQLFFNGHAKCSLSQIEDRCASFWKSFQDTGDLNSNFRHLNKKSYHKFLVKAVATLEPKCLVQSKDEEKEGSVLLSSAESQCSVIGSSASGDSEKVDEKEQLRRLRISKANKGKTPWNKGRKHSPETLQRIKERTRLAMQNPKVKMKLAKVGHVQSRETRIKIAVGVRMGWKKRRERLLLQENCLFDWQNLIAEAARKGFLDEEELQWDSYKIINEQLKQEWLASIEDRKMNRRPKASKRAPKSFEQRRKIAEAIAAKWADPEYRSKVSSGMAKYYETSDGTERRVKRKSSGGSRTPRTPKKKVNTAERSAATETKVRTQQPKLKKRTAPKYKDPLANSKLEMLKNIRAQRVASEAKKNEALERAKLLIAEAKKAAKALEVAATRSPVARASLIEARKLIAEATQSIESIENREATSQDDMTLGQQTHRGLHREVNVTGTVFEQKTDGRIHVDEDENSLTNDADQGLHREVNGTGTGFVQKVEGQIQAEKAKSSLTNDVNQGLHRGVNGSSTGFVQKTDYQIQLEKYGSPLNADQGHHIGFNGTNTGFVQKIDGKNLNAGLYKMSMLEEMDMNHQLRRQLGGYEYPKLDLGSFIGKSELQELIDQQHSHELNSLSSHHYVTKLQVHGEQVTLTPAKRVTKKWVRGRLVEVRERERDAV